MCQRPPLAQHFLREADGFPMASNFQQSNRFLTHVRVFSIVEGLVHNTLRTQSPSQNRILLICASNALSQQHLSATDEEGAQVPNSSQV
jgi:hypothetical protein